MIQKRLYAASRDLFGVPQSRTPCFGRLYDALPEESRTARVKLVVPQGASADTDLVVHLAGTGDHGFERRLHLGFPLVKQVCPPRITRMSLRGGDWCHRAAMSLIARLHHGAWYGSAFIA